MQERPTRRQNRVFKRLHKPLTYLGFERTLAASTAIPVPAVTPAKAFLAPGSPWANCYPPITIAMRLATLATVPVNKV
jgi:hypothetical protein